MVLKKSDPIFRSNVASQHLYSVSVHEKPTSQFRVRTGTILFPRDYNKVSKIGKEWINMFQALHVSGLEPSCTWNAMAQTGQRIDLRDGTRIAGLLESGAIVEFWSYFTVVIKALLTNTLILARRTFAAVLGILDHGLAKEAQKLALFGGAKGRSHWQASIQLLERSDKISLVQKRECRNEDSGVLELSRVIFGRDGLAPSSQWAHAFSDCVTPRDCNRNTFSIELRNKVSDDIVKFLKAIHELTVTSFRYLSTFGTTSEGVVCQAWCGPTKRTD